MRGFVNILVMSQVTEILNAIRQGDQQASAELLPLVYDELRKLAAARLAHEKPGQTLQATALVHEAYLRLAGGGAEQNWNSRGHFFGAAAEAMRRILVENARSKKRLKRLANRGSSGIVYMPSQLICCDLFWPLLQMAIGQSLQATGASAFKTDAAKRSAGANRWA